MQITEVKVNLFLLTKMIKPAPLLTETKKVCIKKLSLVDPAFIWVQRLFGARYLIAKNTVLRTL